MGEDLDRILETIRAIRGADARRRAERPGSTAYESADREVDQLVDLMFHPHRTRPGSRPAPVPRLSARPSSRDRT